jgi:hypothetical protein
MFNRVKESNNFAYGDDFDAPQPKEKGLKVIIFQQYLKDL